MGSMGGEPEQPSPQSVATMGPFRSDAMDHDWTEGTPSPKAGA